MVDLLDHVERDFTERGDRHRRGGRPARGAGLRARRALRGGEAPPPRQPAGPQLRAERQGLLHARPRQPRRRLHGPARRASWAGPRSASRPLENAAFLHDIGKIGVSDRVLLKAGPLTSEEWELVRQHPGISAEIVRPLFDEELVAGVRHHHERFDGRGYPDGLAGEAIPLVARAMCVVDCYDAMSCQRPYRPRAELQSVPGRAAALQRHAVRPGHGRGLPARACGACSGSERASRTWPEQAAAAHRPRRPRPAAHARRRSAARVRADGRRPARVARQPPAGALHHELRAGGRPVHHRARHRRDARTRSRTAATPGCPRTRARPRAGRREPARQRPRRRRLRRLGVGHRPGA